MILHDFEQYSTEWWAIRQGIPTASRASEIITAKTGVMSTSSFRYMNELIAEKYGLGDPPIEPTEWMLRGTELEPEARRFFTFDTGMPVREVGFVTNDEGTAGASPDSLVLFDENENDRGVSGTDNFRAGLEIKCPKPSTHIGYLLNTFDLPDVYKQQVHFSLAVTGLDLWYWMSYHPELDPVLLEVKRDDYTAKVEKALHQFVINQCEAMQKLGIS